MRTSLFLIPLFMMLSIKTTNAAEGMYIPLNLNKKIPFSKLKALGLELDAKSIEALSPAIMKIAHGGTGSFVSPTGLLVTNHHVAYGCIAALSSTKKHWGILKKGYYAKRLADELPCPGYDLMVVAEISDVTATVLSAVKKGTKLSAQLKARRIKAETMAEECGKKTGYHCEVKSYTGGTKYYLNKYMKIKDVRLVYAPPSDLGKFGGDIDNWRYPRHTADFTFLRAYVSPDGKGNGVAKTNKPYRPKKFLQISTTSNPVGKINLVMGFPGRTSRFHSSHSARFQATFATPLKNKVYKGVFSVLKGVAANDSLSRAKYASLIAGLANAEKYYMDSASHMVKNTLVAKKEAAEQRIRAGLKKPDQKEFDALLKEIGNVYKGARGYYHRYLLLSVLARVAPSLRGALYIARWNRIKKQKSVERDYDIFKDRNLYRVKGYLARLDHMGTPAGDKAMIAWVFSELDKLAKGREPLLRPLKRDVKAALARMKREARGRKMTLKEYYRFAMVDEWSDSIYDQIAALIYAKTAIFAWSDTARERKRTIATRMKYFNVKSGEVAKVTDPLLQLGVSLDKALHAIDKKEAKDLHGLVPAKLRPTLAMKFFKAKYHDANFTLRLSYGVTANYKDSVTKKHHKYYTGLSGMLSKFTGKEPFSLPASFRRVARRRYTGQFYDATLKDVPLNYTTKLDTTGGNSGSPVLNGKGELIGLLFDGTPESILSDWYYRQDQRSICFDIRFALYMARRWTKANRLLKELGYEGTFIDDLKKK